MLTLLLGAAFGPVAEAAIPANDGFIGGYAAAVLERDFKISPDSLTVRDGVISIDSDELRNVDRDKLVALLKKIRGVVRVDILVRGEPLPAVPTSQRAPPALTPAKIAPNAPPVRIENQPPAVAAAQLESNELFQQLLQDPTNLDLTFRYAEVNASMGRFEQAITALERMLFFNPNLPRVQLELGVLYFRLGSFAVARGYLERAASGRDVPPEVKSRIDQYLAQIARLESPHQFSGALFAGMQVQTNANAGPASTSVRVLGFDATLNDQFTKQRDYNFFATGSLLYSYNLENQDHDTFDVSASAFASRYGDQDQLNLAYVEATAGPRFNITGQSIGLDALGVQGASTRPYLIGNYVTLGNAPFFASYGFGLEGTATLPWNLSFKAAYERRQKNYRNSTTRTLTRQLSGSEDVYSMSLSEAITDNSLVSLTVSKIDQSARTTFDSNSEYGGTLSYQIYYASPIGQQTIWQTTATVGRYWTKYDAPDPLFDPGLTRFDRRWRFGVSQAVGVTQDASVIVQAQRDIVSSTLPNFTYNNWSFLFGPQWRF